MQEEVGLKIDHKVIVSLGYLNASRKNNRTIEGNREMLNLQSSYRLESHCRLSLYLERGREEWRGEWGRKY